MSIDFLLFSFPLGMGEEEAAEEEKDDTHNIHTRKGNKEKGGNK